ncbi:PREDICTED: uncharacterized protein LOC105965401 [Erythranthe guttata]|uniref:uncharacterized protein LOC105965401 n=1 Tax=Erythranthe guttata TaxID=4155 RepID=UPI00064DFB9A|nr:PREDICTED: uncharacterized protein LOC105965401 [Erythranthe guttata]|eukprot:XP_012845397.1 PREDICTED: uncharacterized protein LOC105965401 [Erythranthe guttata]
MEMIFIDAQGDTVQASIKYTLLYRFESKIKVNRCYNVMSNLSAFFSVKTYKHALNDYRVTFEYTSTVREVDVPSIPMYSFKFTPYADIQQASNNNEYTIDVIGSLLSIGEVQPLSNAFVEASLLTGLSTINLRYEDGNHFQVGYIDKGKCKEIMIEQVASKRGEWKMAEQLRRRRLLLTMDRAPSVIRLSFHLPDHQPIVFNENQSLQSVLNRPPAKQTMFLAWFEANKNYPHARDLRDACYVFGLLDDDKEYIDAIIEVNTWAPGDYLHISDESLKNYTLTEIEKILQSNGKSLRNYAPMPIPIEFSAEDTVNILVLDELDYDRLKWLENFNAAVRSKGKIVINIASSGIASLLLPGGRNAHSRFGLPINVHESSTCSISQQSPHAGLLIRAKLIIWDEAPMMHRYCFEAIDKTIKSILQVDKLFGGKVVVLGGDFRQILPVVLKASRQDIVGNEDDGKQNDGEASIEIPDDMLIGDSKDPFRDLLEFIYPDLSNNMYDPDYFQGRAILAPTNECVESVNDHLMSLLPGEEKMHLSSDSMCRDEQTMEDYAEIYSTQFLNTIRCSELRSHALKFKRRQFPLIVSFALTINKSQGQTLSHVGSYLPRHVFSHDQLYVALSRVTSRGGIKIFIKSDSGELTNVIRNVVYKEVFLLYIISPV